MTKRIVAPRGFHFTVLVSKYRNKIETVHVNLFDNKTDVRIGYVILERASSKKFETHSHLSSDYWDRGLGTLLYSKAIQWCHNHKFKVGSSDSPSDLAQRVWQGKGLRKRFTIRRRPYNGYRKAWNALPKKE